jgi:hypothetical protein
VLRLVCFARLDCTLSNSHDSVLFAAQLIFNLPAICIESTNMVRHRYASIAEVIFPFDWQLLNHLCALEMRQPMVGVGFFVRLNRASIFISAKAHAAVYEIPICGPKCAHVAVPAMRGLQTLLSDTEKRQGSGCLISMGALAAQRNWITTGTTVDELGTDI